MKRVFILTLALGLGLVGCGRRQAVETGGGSDLATIPNDAGGYAGDMAEKPAEMMDLDKAKLEANIEAGQSTSSRDPIRPPEEPEAEDDPAHHDEPAAKPAQDPKVKDTSGDSQWQSVSQPVVAFQFPVGVVYLELWPDVAPKHVANMLKLVKQKFYDGIFIHRVEPGFVVQLGCPNTKVEGPQGPNVGTGGPGWTVPAEFSKKPHIRGTLSMARSNDPNSAGSQFFLCLDTASFLDGQYSVFGRVLGDGMSLVDKLKIGDPVHYAWVVKE